MIPTVFTTAFVYFARQQRVIAAAVIGSISSLAPTLGPTIGGWITENYSWHWLFFINLLMLYITAWIVPDFTISSFRDAIWATIIIWAVNAFLQSVFAFADRGKRRR